MKYEILRKYGIKIIRCSANESDEENRIREKLKKVLNLNNGI